MKKQNVNNIFYGVIGVATLMLAIVGATFAYFTATATNTASITGNMATISFDVTVGKVSTADDLKGGLIPMSNNMIERALDSGTLFDSNGDAVTNYTQVLKTGANVCTDDNGNAVCQIYKINVTNKGSSNIFVDGYVTLNDGSGIPADFPDDSYYKKDEDGNVTSEPDPTVVKNATTMRYAQVFCTEYTGDDTTTTDVTESAGDLKSCTTKGNSTVRGMSTVSFSALGGTSVRTNGANTGEMRTTKDSTVVGNVDINGTGNSYEVINTNYIRISNHTKNDYNYVRANDITSALVFSQFLKAANTDDTDNDGDSSSTYTDSQVYYIVVWLTENGHNQTAGATNAATSTDGFFTGNVTFISSEGYEVTATFSNHARVKSDTPKTSS